MAQTVSYEAAMANLRSMFSGVDDEVIAMLLQSNNGHLERTVEQLLGITGGAADVGAGGGGVPSHSLSVPHSGGGSARRRSSNSERAPPAVSGSNLPDDFLRPPSYFQQRDGGSGRKSSSAAAQIDQDAILAQMLQDEMFMADIRANPELYFTDEAPAHSLQHPHPQAQPTGSHPSYPHTLPPSSSSSPSYVPTSSSPSHPVHAARGDFSGMGTSSVPSSAAHASFRDKFNSLTSAAKKRLLTIAAKRKEAPSKYDSDRTDLASGLLSDADSAETSIIGGGRGKTDSERAGERDVEPAALSASTAPLEDGVYTNDDDGAGQGTGSGYVPPSMVGDLHVGGSGGKKWFRKSGNES